MGFRSRQMAESWTRSENGTRSSEPIRVLPILGACRVERQWMDGHPFVSAHAHRSCFCGQSAALPHANHRSSSFPIWTRNSCNKSTNMLHKSRIRQVLYCCVLVRRSEYMRSLWEVLRMQVSQEEQPWAAFAKKFHISELMG